MKNITIKHDYRLVLIEWEDSVLGFQGWKLIKDQPKILTKFISVGFLVNENKKSITLYPHIENSKNGKEITGTGDIIIPKSAIKKRTQLL